MTVKSGCDMRKLPDTKLNRIRDYKSEGEIWLWQIQLL